MIPQEADQTHIEYGFPVVGTHDKRCFDQSKFQLWIKSKQQGFSKFVRIAARV